MGRKKSSFLDDLFEITAKMPWWVGVLLALFSYLGLHIAAEIQVAPAKNPGQLGPFMVGTLVHTFAMVLQYLVPLPFLAGAGASAWSRYQRKQRFDVVGGSAGAQALRDIDWREFETLVAEGFRRKGFDVKETGGGGADGGVDLELRTGRELYLVQCKHWRAYSVPVVTVRELYGVMASRGAAGGFIVSSGKFTPDAAEFARETNVELIDGNTFFEVMMNGPPSEADVGAVNTSTPNCPTCGKLMVLRRAKKGANAGSQFWGCSSFPACKGTRPL